MSKGIVFSAHDLEDELVDVLAEGDEEFVQRIATKVGARVDHMTKYEAGQHIAETLRHNKDGKFTAEVANIALIGHFTYRQRTSDFLRQI